VAAQLPVDGEQSPRAAVEAAVDAFGMRLTAPRAAHQREGHERFTLARILAEEVAVLDLVDAQNPRAMLWVRDEHRWPVAGSEDGGGEHRPLAVAGATLE
ncbi:hypothetical protein RBA06_21665, partial [Mycobacteroides abscessus subsp. abscessus]